MHCLGIGVVIASVEDTPYLYGQDRDHQEMNKKKKRISIINGN